MRELLKVLKFDMELERFAEVFGDCIEAEDLAQFRNGSPLTAEDLKKGSSEAFYYTEGSPQYEFEVLDMATQSKLNNLTKSKGFDPSDLRLIRIFFGFINDAYGWYDIGDLERWEEELFDALNGYEQKNYEPLELNEDTESRFALLCQFVLYLIEYYAELTVESVVDIITADIGEDNGRLWEFYQTHKKEEF